MVEKSYGNLFYVSNYHIYKRFFPYSQFDATSLNSEEKASDEIKISRKKKDRLYTLSVRGRNKSDYEVWALQGYGRLPYALRGTRKYRFQDPK
jgi:hypothetical protein